MTGNTSHSPIPTAAQELLDDAVMYARTGREKAFVGYLALHQPPGVVPLARELLHARGTEISVEAHTAAELARYPHEMQAAYELAGLSWQGALVRMAEGLLRSARLRLEDEEAAR